MDLAQLQSVLVQEAGAVEELLTGLKAELQEYHDPSWRQLLAVVQAAVDAAKAGSLPAHSHGVHMVQEAAWEKLHLGHWKDVSVLWRDLYALACLLHASLALAGHVTCVAEQAASGMPTSGPADSTAVEQARLKEAVRACDLAVMMGGPGFRHLLHAAIWGLEQQLAQMPSAPAGEDAAADVLPPAKRAHLSTGASAASNEEGEAGAKAEEARGEAATAEVADGALGTGGHRAGWGSWRADGCVRLPPGSLSQGLLATRPPVLHVPALESFLQQHMLAPGGGRPAIITDMLLANWVRNAGAMEGWPAMERWQDMKYLASVAGHRTVPIEVGEHYLVEEWGQQLMTVAEFIQHHIASKQPSTCGPCAAVPSAASGAGSGPVTEGADHEPTSQPQGADDGGTATNGAGRTARGRGYLAQHALFEQIPALAADILTPEYCVLGKEEEEGGGVQAVNAWFGPAGTVTPLHTDPHHNLLCQVVGSKYVRLYSPAHTPNMYPFTEGMNTNSSQVTDLTAVDAAQFPLFSQAPYIDCVLSEGMMLYIPPGWWHAVYSLSVSFSVSYWWC